MRRELGGGGRSWCLHLGVWQWGPWGAGSPSRVCPLGLSLGARPRSWMKSRGAALGPASASVSSHPLITSI